MKRRNLYDVLNWVFKLRGTKTEYMECNLVYRRQRSNDLVSISSSAGEEVINWV